tara:strand:- start:320 stop:1627 length:1308 start_codon:yes stop_codon:yes gene_type:complete
MDNALPINRDDLSNGILFMRLTPTINTCRNIIQQQLFSNGITFGGAKGNTSADPHMQEVMTDFWLPFCKNLLDAVISQGFAIVRVITMDDGLRVPIILESTVVNVYLNYNLGVREYFIKDNENNIIPDTIVLDSFGFSPTHNGRICSMVCNLLPTIRYMNSLMGTSLSMEQTRASPNILTESVELKSDNVEGIQYDYYADGDMLDDSELNKFKRNRSNVEQLQHQQQMYDNFFGGNGSLSSGGNILENVVALPLGQKLVNMPPQTGRSDLVAQIKMQEDVICGMFGVPRGLFMSDTPHKADNEGAHDIFQKTIMNWKNMIQDACQHIFSLIYAEEMSAKVLQALGKRKRKKNRNDIAEVYALKKKLAVQIIFPVSPFANSEELYQHYQNGIIPWETMVQHSCAAHGIPHTVMPEMVVDRQSQMAQKHSMAQKSSK